MMVMRTLERKLKTTGQTMARLNLTQCRRFCSNTSKPTDNHSNNTNSNDKVEKWSLSHYQETYKQLDKLDFMTATKILFTDPPKKKKFGLDFHLVQFFFACLPSLAVYLVAQYARSEMRKMDAELEVKKKKEEEERAEEAVRKVLEEKETYFDPEILEVKERLEKLEEAIKGIVVESQRQSGSVETKPQQSEQSKSSGKTSSTVQKSEQHLPSTCEKKIESATAPDESQEGPKRKSESLGGNQVTKR